MDDVKKPVGIWLRVSTEDQAKGESPEHHEKRARFYAESRSWEVVEVYRLEAVSGKSVMDHSETKRMLQGIRSGHVSGLIFSKLARLARNTRELLEFADLFREHNADLISLQESIDTSTPAGRLFYTMIAAMAQWEREEIAERVAASVPIRAKLGKPLGGQASFGYCWKERKLIPDPTEAPVRKLIYELFLEHKRKRTVARLLNDMGYRTRKGSRFSDTTVGRLLKDPSAKGLHRANYTKSLGDNKKWVLKSKDEWIFQKVEPVVLEEVWDQCNAILEEQEKRNKRPSRKAVHLFTAFAFCHCGQKMYVPSNSPKYTCYKCRNKIGTEDLEEIFHQQLKTFFFSSVEISNYLNNADHLIKEKERLLNALEEEKQKVRREMEKIYRSYIDEEIDVKTYGSQYRPLTARVEQIENQIPELQGEIDFLKIQYLSSDQILTEAKDLYSRWPKLTAQEKRAIIENITEQIVVGQEEITINLCYLPSSHEIAASSQRNFIPALPFCQIKLTAQKPVRFPRYHSYPQNPETWGDHLKTQRLNMQLTLKETARQIGTSISTVINWETNRNTPSLKFLPKIVEFLGYTPKELIPKTLGEKLVFARHLLGLSQKTLASRLEIDPTTLSRLERSNGHPSRKVLGKLKSFSGWFPHIAKETDE